MTDLQILILTLFGGLFFMLISYVVKFLRSFIPGLVNKLMFSYFSFFTNNSVSAYVESLSDFWQDAWFSGAPKGQ